MRGRDEYNRILKLLAAVDGGRFSDIAFVAQGGHAFTFKAFDRNNSRRLVAIKIKKPGGSDVIDEGWRVRGLGSHPNIVEVIDLVRYDPRENDRGLIMAFVDGGSLRDYLPRLKGEIGTAVDIAVGVARALDKAHSGAVVHRDVKPENILMGPNASPMLTDFGIATRPSKVPGDLVGSVAYMAPENLSLDGHGVDPRSDLYSLTVVLYEMLEGSTPHTAETTTTLISKIRHEAPHQLNPNVPASLQRIVVKGLQKDPALRYQSARQMILELEMFNEFYRRVLVPLDEFEHQLGLKFTGEDRAQRFLFLGERYLELATQTFASLCDDLPEAEGRRLRSRLDVLLSAAEDGTVGAMSTPGAAPAAPERRPLTTTRRTSASTRPLASLRDGHDAQIAEIDRLLTLEDIATAQARANELIDRPDLHPSVYIDVAHRFYRRGLFDNAVEYSDSGLRRHRDDADLYAIRGKALLPRQEARREALNALKEAVERGTADLEAVELYNDFKASS